MANTRALLKRRKAVINTRKITKTMEQISTAKMARAQGAAVASRPYARQLRDLAAELAVAVRSADETRRSDVSREQGENVPAHPLLRLCPKPRRAVIVLLTSDRGLCGAFNSNLIRLAVEHAVALEKDGCEVELLLHGKKAVAAFKRRKFKISAKFVGVSDKPSYERADEIAELLSDRFVRGEIDAVEIVYSAFLSAASQRPLARRVLPFVIETGVEGSGAEQVKAVVEANEVPQCEYIFHPAPKEILAVMLPKAVKLEFFTAMLETAAGEHSARRIAMKNATDAADEMIKLLTRNYNRVRQAKITQEIAEIVSGANALG